MSLGVRPSRRALSSLYQALDFTDHLRLSEPDLGYTTIRSTSTENIDANRYRDILAYDHALLPGPYLNAAYIPPFHPTSVSFIISQAPPPDTYTAFYTHIVQQRVRVLVNLTPLIEKGRRKADQYWPNHSVGVSGSEGDAEMELGNGWKVTSESEKQIELQQGEATLVRRVIHIDTAQTDGSKNGWAVTQFHLSSWPDHGVFPTSLLLQLMHETQQVAMPKIYPPPPTWIHCSAGVGRSGTLAAAYIARAAINVARHEGTLAGDADDSLMARNQRSHVWDLPVRIVEHLRRYRARMVQTIEQFEAVYEIVGELAKQAGSAEK
ncbi:Protein-tyrosine phosphatase, receptor/non-receptor type [Kalmanozyma brasiliensis GHG001]|uniref:Protein-tyrosine phosphatase, receptor/non-receptor type n=1 Tax=Kalmanozyma brasiliensis (strain GHG001) TaxID=1365824 RepID=UPI0028683AEE|nr:Protein-tyrosine phosphatase, receptor/non-receptor type [Kalmanozyma brasiliensis GHG001]EST08186.2 Protein-tyrosine phosphatase, receptor/non-receptor type [Kalmanozyma brasiliensis GHG001]